MKIKDIKSMYSNYKLDRLSKVSFVVYDYKGEIGKVVIVVNRHPNKDIGSYVVQAIRVKDGKELINGCRPCDNLEDAIDVAGEMF